MIKKVNGCRYRYGWWNGQTFRHEDRLRLILKTEDALMRYIYSPLSPEELAMLNETAVDKLPYDEDDAEDDLTWDSIFRASCNDVAYGE